jgi:hypothetical protein
MISQYFIGGMMPESANPVQQAQTIIEIRPFRGGWQCFEGPGVEPYCTGECEAKCYRFCKSAREVWGKEIRVLRPGGSVERMIDFNQWQIDR